MPAVSATEFPIPTAGSTPTSIATAADGNLWFTEFGSDRIGRINATTKAITEFTVLPGSGPLDIVSAPDGNLYFTERFTDRIGRINPRAGSDAAIQASFSDTFATGITAGSGPTSITVGPDGNLWFTEFNTDSVARLTLATGAVNEFAVPGAGSGPAGITSGPDGALWFTEAGSGEIGRITTGGSVTNEFALPISTSDPENIVTAPNGVLYFTELAQDKIGLITTAGAITEVNLALGAAPNDITIGSDNAVFFTEGGLDRIGRLSLTGKLDEFDSGITPGSQPAGITSGPDNAIWFTENTGNRIGRLAIPPVGVLVVGADNTGGTAVKAFDANGNLLFSNLAFPGFNGAVRVGSGDVNGDGILDVIVGAGPGAPGGHVKVFDGTTGALIRSFLSFQGYTGGVFVASGDVNNDGFDDIIVGADAGATGGHVEVFDGRTQLLIQSFFAYPGFSGGVRVAAGDVNGDGFADLITGTGAGAFGGHLKVFDARTNVLLQSYLTFQGFAGGIFVSSGDVNGDGITDVIVGAGPGAPGGHVKAFDGKTQALVSSFFTMPGFSGGVRVASVDRNRDGRADIAVVPGPVQLSNVSIFDALTTQLLGNFPSFAGFMGGAFIGSVGR
ncbi:MAG: FG-GAP repeat protein [Planctomycetes bacterium]|nr:FG-GAP repeat protein [Planctomycetota bacterium]